MRRVRLAACLLAACLLVLPRASPTLAQDCQFMRTIPGYEEFPCPGSLTNYEVDRLANPCQGVIRAMAMLGINPGSFSPAATALRRRAYAVLLPVLVELAADSTLAVAPGVLDERMASQVARAATGTGLYTAAGLQEARQRLADALAASPPSEGALVVAAILTDTESGPPWLAAINHRSGNSTDAVTCANRRPVW